jgi:putative aldouronate transport system permease protein
MRMTLKHMRHNPFLYVMTLPVIVFVFVFNYVPMYGILIAFKDFNVIKGVAGSEWVGFKNFAYFFTSTNRDTVIFNTLFLNALFIAFGTLFAVGIALLLNEVRAKYFKRVAQSVIFLPYFMSWIVISMLVQAFLGGNAPVLNDWIGAWGIDEINWMYEPSIWPWLLTIIKVWQGAGYASIIYLAAISGFPEEIYEAARIDGASRLQVMYRITLPLLLPTVSILTLLSVGKIFNGDFAMIYAIIGDNPTLYPSTDVIDTFVFRAMRHLNDFGMSAAVGLFQSVMGFAFILIANWAVKRISSDSSLF